MAQQLAAAIWQTRTCACAKSALRSGEGVPPDGAPFMPLIACIINIGFFRSSLAFPTAHITPAPMASHTNHGRPELRGGGGAY